MEIINGETTKCLVEYLWNIRKFNYSLEQCQSGYWVSTFVGQNELDFVAKIEHISLEFIVFCE